MAPTANGSSTLKPLPQEIWWLVAEELASRRDFSALYKCARVSKSLSLLALPLMYSIHELSPACAGDVFSPDIWARLWRTLILSSLGQTYYPYCLWIKTLKLGNFYSLLEDLARDGLIPVDMPSLRASFFGPPLDSFHVVKTSVKKVTRNRGQPMDLDAIVSQVADRVTEFIKTSADKDDMTVTLSSLEGYHLPTAYLPKWVSRLAQLTSLTIRDGSVLNAEVAQAIRENCPSFKEVVCHYCKGTEVDQELASFFRGLPPNTLESFTVMSMNDVGPQSLQALSGHSETLKRLRLYVEMPAFTSLNLLSDCKSIESLSLEANGIAKYVRWETQYAAVFQEVVEWLKQCISLTDISLQHMADASSILAAVLQVPEIRLTTLEAKIDQVTPALYVSLGLQTGLEELSIQTTDDIVDLADALHIQFMDSVVNCGELRELKVPTEPMTLEDLARLTTATPKLESLSFTGDMDDACLEALARFLQLKQLSVYGLSSFSVQGILAFIAQLVSDNDAGAHEGLSFAIMGQLADNRFQELDEALLQSQFASSLRGTFDISYMNDPDELHLSDFSD